LVTQYVWTRKDWKSEIAASKREREREREVLKCLAVLYCSAVQCGVPVSNVNVSATGRGSEIPVLSMIRWSNLSEE
jgi:hypothetical protein